MEQLHCDRAMALPPDELTTPLLALVTSMTINIEAPENKSSQVSPDDDAALMRKALMVAKIYYQNHLADPEASAFVEKRGISKHALRKFEIGHAPLAWRGLVDHFSSHKVRLAAIDAGLVKEQRESRRLLDFYRGRLMFPIRSLSGELVGYGGRIIEKVGEEPKYINSPETLLFNKSNELYGAFQNQKRIAELQEAIVVEGYLDVTTTSTNGFDYSVAPMGTALTPGHIKMLLNMGVRKMYIALDGDSAGRSAAKRSIDVIMEQYRPSLEVMVMPMPDGEDPDSLIVKGGKAAFQNIMDSAVPLAEYIHQICCEDFLDPPCLEDQACYLWRLEAYVENASGYLESKLIQQACEFTKLTPDRISWIKRSFLDNEAILKWNPLVMLASRWMMHDDDPLKIARVMARLTIEDEGTDALVELATKVSAGELPSGLMFEYSRTHGPLTDHEITELHEKWGTWVKQKQFAEAVNSWVSDSSNFTAKDTIRTMMLR